MRDSIVCKPVVPGSHETMDPTIENEATLRLRAEELALRTASVLDREIGVGRDVVEGHVRFDVTLLVEELRITERPADAVYRDVPPIDEPQRLLVRLSRERAHLAVRVVEYERVTIGRRDASTTARVAATLAHDELAIEHQDGSSV